MFTETRKVLTHQAVMTMLAAGIAKAEAIGQPQCIVIVDSSGEQALTSASIGAPSNVIPEAVRPAIGAATDGTVTGLPGGLPIWMDGELVGGIGVGSGSGEQDILVGTAALESIGAKAEI